MGVSVPLKLKDSAGLQSFDSDDYDFLAYRAGLQLRQSDSSDTNAITRFHADGRNVLNVGTLTNTVYDSAVGTGGDTSLLSVTTIGSNVYRNVGTDGEGSLETYNDSNYANLFYQTDSASQQQLVAFSDSDWNVVNNEIISRIYKYDYVGSVRLASAVTDFDSANGGWSNILPNFFSDTRTTDSAADSDISYSIFQKIDMTGIGVPSDSAKPFSMKYNPDSAEVRIDGELQFAGRDSDLPKTSGRIFPPTPGTIYRKSTTNRVGFSLVNLQTDSGWIAGSSYLDIGLSAEWNDTIWGRYKTSNLSIKGKHKTPYLTAPRSEEYNNNEIHTGFTFHVHKDSVGDTLSDRIGSLPQKWVGIKGRIDLADSARFGSTRATHAATNALMQKHVESDGKWTIQFNFDSATEFQVHAMGSTSSFPVAGNSAKLYPTEDTIESTSLATEVFLRPGVNFLRSRANYSTTAAEQPTPDSATREILQGLSGTGGAWNGRIGGEFGPFNGDGGSYQPIGADSADEISLIFKNDFQGFQIADSDQLDETIGTRARNHILADSDAIGSIKILSATEGDPNTQGYTGNWISKGTATDTRKALVDTNYTRTRVSTYANLRTSEYTRVFTETYDRTRTSNYSVGFIGNYANNFDRTRSSEYISNYTRNRFSTFSRSFLGNYSGNFEGNFTQNFTGNFAGNYVGSSLVTVPSGTSITYTVNTVYTGPIEFEATFTYNSQTLYIWKGNYQPKNSVQNIKDYNNFVVASQNTGGPSVGDTFTVTLTRDSVFTTGGQDVDTFIGNYVRGGSVFIGNYQNTQLDYTRTSTRVSTTNVTADSTRVSTRTSVQDIIYQYIGDYTRSSSRNFVGNYSRNFSRTRPAFFSRDFIGNYTGDYSRDFAGNYAGDFVGDFTSSYTGNYNRNFAGNYTGNYSRDFAGNYIGNYSRDFVGNFTGNYVGGDTFASAKFSTTSPRYYFSVSQTGGGKGGYQETLTIYWNDVLVGSQTLGNNSMSTGTTSHVGTDGYTYYRNGAGLGTSSVWRSVPDTFTRTSTRTRTSSFTNTSLTSRSSTYSADYARTRASNFSDDYSRTSTRNSEVNYLRTRASNFSDDYSRTRTSEYLAGENFSRTFAGNYTGDYTGNFSREFLGNYSRNFTGDFVGEAIGTTNTTIQTYTLYVKVG